MQAQDEQQEPETRQLTAELIPGFAQVGEAVRYAKAMRGEPDDPSLAMRPEEGLGGWAALPMVQSVHAMWEDILAMPFPGSTARGPCPDGGYEYAVVVYHYTRTLAFAARCRAAPESEACFQAEKELHLLQVNFSDAALYPLQCFLMCTGHLSSSTSAPG